MVIIWKIQQFPSGIINRALPAQQEDFFDQGMLSFKLPQRRSRNIRCMNRQRRLDGSDFFVDFANDLISSPAIRFVPFFFEQSPVVLDPSEGQKTEKHAWEDYSERKK